MIECHGKNFILNGKLKSSELFDNSLVYEGDSIYEVIRMIKGFPVFFHDHMSRLVTSVRLQKKNQLADEISLRRDILKLLESDRKREINLKIVFNYKKGIGNYLIYFIKSLYPTAEQYELGVKAILFDAERTDPGSKVIDSNLRSVINYKLNLEGGYEAILVDKKKNVTEGSRSNIFFIKDNILRTAPDKAVLGGITRKYILEICREDNIKVEMKYVKEHKIDEYESVFMTGTSPMVLPFFRIDDIFFNVNHPLIGLLRALYISKAAKSIKDFKEV